MDDNLDLATILRAEADGFYDLALRENMRHPTTTTHNAEEHSWRVDRRKILQIIAQCDENCSRDNVCAIEGTDEIDFCGYMNHALREIKYECSCHWCKRFFAKFKCNAPQECDCPKCQNMCECDKEDE